MYGYISYYGRFSNTFYSLKKHVVTYNIPIALNDSKEKNRNKLYLNVDS